MSGLERCMYFGGLELTDPSCAFLYLRFQFLSWGSCGLSPVDDPD